MFASYCLHHFRRSFASAAVPVLGRLHIQSLRKRVRACVSAERSLSQRLRFTRRWARDALRRVYKVVQDQRINGGYSMLGPNAGWRTVFPKWLDERLCGPVAEGGLGLEKGSLEYGNRRVTLFNVRPRVASDHSAFHSMDCLWRCVCCCLFVVV